MPPPLSQQQGSRAGLISTLVVSIIFLVVSLIINFYFNSQLTATRDKLDAFHKKYDPIIPPNFQEATGDYVLLFKEKKNAHAATLVDEAVEQSRQLAAEINGTQDSAPPDVPAVIAASKELVKSTSADLKKADIQLPPESSLEAAIALLAKTVVQQQDQVKASDQAAKAAADQRKQDTEKYAADLKTHDDQVAEASKKTEEAMAEKKAADDRNTATLAKQGEEQNKTVVDTTKALADKDVLIAQAHADLVKEHQINDSLRTQLDKWHTKVKDPLIRQADARIIRVGSTDDVYIDLGRSDRVTSGLTFEVYDKNTGIPKLGDGLSPDNMPEGKASIEVTNIGETACRCRVIKTTPGTSLSEGDICVNLVYDRHTKRNFMVYGDFDMNGDNTYTAAQADMIKNLIVRWGGTVVPKLTVETDFLVLGREPEVPQLTKDEETDPLKVAKRQAAQDALAAYTNLLNEASTLNVTILNQNRFLYYTGYYDLVKR